LGRQVKALGCLYYKWVSPGNDGVPDRIIILPGGHVVFAELKTDLGQTTPMQQYQLRRLRKRGCLAFALHGLEDAEQLVGIVRELIGNAHEN